ncbi:nitroreductase [[Clostridium] sordellii]|uniref:Nitroreductase family protein n=1 Tax=Paraclostridium sordellii TaxID=1505 RepID=A0ABM9RT40_PARSO|nr:nitroreductase family protein [Paeniclostridium sordellii]CEJ75252.1 nitroreductase family protein [[Clostridium] sordellii] [Paeniclostridium sordellii]CEN71057.1 nitroreductase [[Clostridium] sordellii] [Paeniclostridium sordellii]CEN74312.1 nitroreductase [[Clostridium] sordellii] [Paeniclostridium sordellii]CEO30684.1 nitroreductase [[Clostridium] sordellii] [Paeniclostridium sordellii]CEP65892.1 nitroreductase [[Clostridium] sordellii] [Paeniclostridium sordellii]
MQLYDAIFYRKSIKKYSTKKLSIDMFDEVKRLCKDVPSLNEYIKISAHPILKGDSLKFIIKKRHRIVAPHYIVLTAQLPEEEDEENPIKYFDSVGFAGEELVLKLTEMGLATSWLDNSFNKESVSDFVHLKENEIPVMLIAIGFPEGKEELFRKLSDDVDRKAIKNIAKNIDDKWTNVIECVRLSPSYKNSQPWRFYQNNKSLDIYMKKDSNEDLNLVNMGIALKHFEIACKHYNIDFKFVRKEEKDKLRKEYYISVV